MEYHIDPVDFIVGKTGGENRAVRNLLDLYTQFQELEKRKNAVLDTIRE